MCCLLLLRYRFSFFSTMLRNWLWRTSPKWPILCRVWRQTLTQSLRPTSYLGTVRLTASTSHLIPHDMQCRAVPRWASWLTDQYVALRHKICLFMVALCSRADHYILPCAFYLLSSIFFSSPNLRGRRLDVYHTWCGLRANLECMSKMCCTRLAENTGRKKIAILAPSHNIVGLYLRSWGMYRQSEKNVKHRYLLHMSS